MTHLENTLPYLTLKPDSPRRASSTRGAPCERRCEASRLDRACEGRSHCDNRLYHEVICTITLRMLSTAASPPSHLTTRSSSQSIGGRPSRSPVLLMRRHTKPKVMTAGPATSQNAVPDVKSSIGSKDITHNTNFPVSSFFQFWKKNS